MNGYQACAFRSDSTSSGTFGQLQTLLQQDGEVVNFFDNCITPSASIEELANELGSLIQSYPSQVDVIAHSMGGLIVRSYLSGQQPDGTFNPPLNSKIRKMVFIGAPNYGVLPAFSDSELQVQEMQYGSQFLWQLSTWNQAFDDLRGTNSIAIIGTGGSNSGPTYDGVVTAASASISFSYKPERTRALPFCHTNPTGFAAFEVNCSTSASLAGVTDRSHPSYRIIRSFLSGSDEWKDPTISAQLDQLSGWGGVFVEIWGSNNQSYSLGQFTQTPIMSAPGSISVALAFTNVYPPVFFSDAVPAASYTLSFAIQGQPFTIPLAISAGRFSSVLVKFPPHVALVVPSAGKPSAISVAAESLISIYGAGLSASTAQASGLPLPTQLSDVTITLAGKALQLIYVSPGQINAILPATVPGLWPMTLSNSFGQHTISLMVENAVPTVFTLDGSGNGLAAALHATDGLVVNSGSPAADGEYISLFATGLGPTYTSGGIQHAKTTPTVTISGIPAFVSFAGRAPGFLGLDQINVLIPAVPSGTAAVVVQSGNRISNTVALSIR